MTTLEGSILITGANGGLGSAFAHALSKSAFGSRYQGVYTVRKPSTAISLHSILQHAPGSHQSEVLSLDLGSLDSVRHFAQDINNRVEKGTLGPIRALILNAGWQDLSSTALKPTTFTDDGLEAAFQVNYLSNFLLVLLLLQSMDKNHGRIIFVSSCTHDAYHPANESLGIFRKEDKEMFTNTDALSKGIDYVDDGAKAGTRRYGASKLAMVMFMYSLQRRLKDDRTLSKISVLSLDPGGMAGTGMGNTGPLIIRVMTGILGIIIQEILALFMSNALMRPTRNSAADLLFAAFDEKTLGMYPRKVFLNGHVVADSSIEAKDEKKQEQLWEDSVRIAGLKKEESILVL